MCWSTSSRPESNMMHGLTREEAPAAVGLLAVVLRLRDILQATKTAFQTQVDVCMPQRKATMQCKAGSLFMMQISRRKENIAYLAVALHTAFWLPFQVIPHGLLKKRCNVHGSGIGCAHGGLSNVLLVDR